MTDVDPTETIGQSIKKRTRRILGARPSRMGGVRRIVRSARAGELSDGVDGEAKLGQIGAQGGLLPENPLVPPGTVARNALIVLVAIMSFLACLTVAGITVVNNQAEGWQRQIAEEVTIQVRPNGDETARDLARAVELALQMPGVQSARALSEIDSAALLEPWLGEDFDRTELPVPRLIAVKVSANTDLPVLAERLRVEVPTASLDDHGAWLDRLGAMANATILVGMGLVALVLAATALCVIFATRGAMAGNRDVIEVLHFVGAEDTYVAREFQRHFLVLGLKGAGMGGLAAIILFGIASLLASPEGPTPEETQLRSLFGGLDLGASAFFWAVATVLLIAILIAGTAHVTVRRTLKELD